MLMQQKKSCDAMIDEKNKLINDFQLELKQKDDHYVKVSSAGTQDRKMIIMSRYNVRRYVGLVQEPGSIHASE